VIGLADGGQRRATRDRFAPRLFALPVKLRSNSYPDAAKNPVIVAD
jgi:hypothetical protein